MSRGGVSSARAGDRRLVTPRRARPHYEAEGISLRPTRDDDGYRIDLAASRWRP